MSRPGPHKNKASRTQGKLITQQGNMAIKLISSVNGVKKTDSNNGYSGKPITEIITNGFFTVDKKWTVKYWNKAAEKLLGVQAEDIVGKNLWEKFAGAIPLEFYAVYHKAFLQQTPLHFEEYWGEMGVWFDIVTYHDDDTLSVSFKNIDQPEYPEQQLKMLNELYKFVTEVTNDCLWEWNFQTRELLWIDGGHKRVFGYQIENALIPQSFWESRLHPDDKERILTRLNKVIAGGTGCIWEDEYRFQKANGDYAYVHDRGHIIYEGDKASRMIGATQDITARKSAELKLLESEKKLSLIARQTVNALVITDAEEKITWVNSAFTRITEYEPEEVMGRKPGSFLQGEETDPLTVQYLRQRIKDKLPFDCEIVNYSKSGRKYWIRVQGQPLLDENGNCERYFAIETDITGRVLLEDKLAEEKKNRQKDITDAVLTAQENERADIGKELHDDLNQVLAAAQLYIQMANTHEDKRELFLEKSCSCIVNVIEKIRKISKTLIPLDLQFTGLYVSIKNLLADLLVLYPVKIEFNADGVEEEYLDEKLQLNIFRIVQEQLNNILKHAHATRATIILSRRENEILLLISDNGQGCNISEKRNGVGIRNIMGRAELCHGKAEIESRPGEGFQLKVVMQLFLPQPLAISA
jgi:PAS domain S-box-containing protein